MLFVLRVGSVTACGVQTYFSVNALFCVFGIVFGVVCLCFFHAEKFCVCACVYNGGACNGIRAFYPLSHKRLENRFGVFADVCL